MKSLALRLVLVALVSLLLAACSSPAPAPTAVPPTKAPAAAPAAPAAAAPTKAPAAAPTKAPVQQVKVTVAQTEELPYYGAWNIARAGGFLKEEGIELDVVLTGSGAKAAAALASGGADFIPSGWGDTINAASAGQPATSLMSLNNEYAYDVVLRKDVAEKLKVNENSPEADKLKALKGLKFGITSPGGGVDQLTRYLVRKAGLDPDRDIDMVAGFTAPTLIQGLTTKQIDAYTYPPPAGTTSVVRGDAVYLFQGTKGQIPGLKDYPYSAISVNTNTARDKADMVQRFIRAQVRGYKLLKEDPAKAKALTKQLLPPTDEKVFNLQWDVLVPSFRHPDQTKAEYEIVINFLKAGGKKIPDTMTYEKAYNGTFVDKAIKEVGFK